MIYLFYVLIVYACIIMVFSYDFRAGNADYLIIPGSGLKDNRENFTMVSRVDRALIYLNRYPDCKVIVSGGITDHNTVSEASIMAKLLDDRHIRKDRIILEDRSKNTKENILYSKKLIPEGRKTVICSNNYHILRCKINALKCGMKVNSIFCRSSYPDLLIHLPIEEVLIIKDLIA
ncbi:MAG: YdcF family protein [Erysipelotrichaceae bacterium]|nr:YdcF family protein [Erysipelotrichaceae bacterium]